MVNVAAHVRIFDATPDDDLVKKRTSAVKELGKNFSKGRSVVEIYKIANGIAQAASSIQEIPHQLSGEIETAIQKTAKAFIAEGNELEISVCALLGAIEALEGSTPTTANLVANDVLAIGLWSALTFQTPRDEGKLELLRQEVIEAARIHVQKAASSSRVRAKVPDVAIQTTPEYDGGKLKEAVASGLKPTIDALRNNAALDREELDILWWVIANWSDLLGRPFTAGQNNWSESLAIGLEAGKLMRRMPNDSYRRLILRRVTDNELVTLEELIQKIGEDMDPLSAAHHGNAFVTSCPQAFPLLTALSGGDLNSDGWQIPRPLSEWSSRAFLESSAVHVGNHLPNVGI